MRDKKSNKPIIIAGVIIIAIVALFIATAVFYPILAASQTRDTVLERIGLAGAGDIMVVSDPRAYEDGIVPVTATATLEGEEVTQMARQILRVTDGAEYSEIRTDLFGAWDINVELRTDDGIYTVYFTERQFYVTKELKAFVYDIDEGLIEEYTSFYKELRALTAQG